MPSDRRRWRAYAIVLAAGFMTMLDVSIVNVALPSIERFLGAGTSHVQWIVAGYSLSFGLALVPAGRLGDVLGRRGTFLAGLSGFVLASALCGAAPSAEWLVAMRILQGVFAGILNPQVIALIQELFAGSERGRAFGYFGMTIGISTAIGPLLGGLLVSGLGPMLGWRSVFLINVPIGAVVIPAAAHLLPKGTAASRARAAAREARPEPTATGPMALGEQSPRMALLDIDLLGLVLLGAAVLAVMWPFVSSSESLARAPWWTLAIAAAALPALGLWERRLARSGGRPILSAVLLRDRGFVLGASLGTLYFAGFTGIFLVVTLYVQNGLGYPAWRAGVVQAAFAVPSAVEAARSGRRVADRGRRLVVRGLVLFAAGLCVLIACGWIARAPSAAWLVPIGLAIAGAGSGQVISPNQALTLADVPRGFEGTASGLLQTLQRLGAAMGIALLTTTFFARLASAGGTSDARATIGPYGHALSAALLVTLALVLGALALAVADVRGARRSRP